MGYPMSAIVGQEEARLALCLLAVNPAVGGVLLIGGRGVGKSVLARGLKRFCIEPWMQAGWTEVPVYINQEQLAGKNGILERAKSSWLYMDEINLLADQAGRTLAVEADCRGMIGTMDPEEGSLPEYLKERFGLTVFLEGEKEPEKRMEIIRRNLEYEATPERFQSSWKMREQKLAAQIQAAQKRMRQVRVTESARAAAAEMTEEAGCAGNRAELYLIETARALAAWGERDGDLCVASGTRGVFCASGKREAASERTVAECIFEGDAGGARSACITARTFPAGKRGRLRDGGRRPGSITVWRTGSIAGRQTGFHVCIPIGRGK